MLEKYENSSDKERLISMLSYICINLSNDVQEDDKLLLKNTPNYFLFSFYGEVDEVPTYVLISKDYKRFIVASEEMECFDDNDFDEDERYGIYEYDYFFLENNKIRYIQICDKEYTKDYNGKFDNLMLYCEIEESEKYYDSLLSVKKLKKVIKMKKTIKECADEILLRTLGISYDEYEKLDFDEQQRLMSEHHKKHPNKSKEVTVMIGGGDESIFIKVPRGEKVLTSNGYFIAGETLEENRKKIEEHEQIVIEKEKKLDISPSCLFFLFTHSLISKKINTFLSLC